MANHMFNKKLIEEVKKHEFIYNLAHPDRRKGKTSTEKWLEIASVLGDTVKKCKHRWNSLRRRYKSEYLKMTSNNEGTAYESEWKYMDEMSFLQGYVLQDETFLESISKLSRRDMFCRTCLRSFADSSELNLDSYNIFGTENFAKKLMQCTNLKAVPWDEYPHSLCRKCYEKVLDFCKFQDMCRDSMEKFNVMLENKIDSKIEEESTDSFLDSVVEYAQYDFQLDLQEPSENHTNSGNQDGSFTETSEHQKYNDDVRNEVDPLAERIDSSFPLEEQHDENLIQFNPDSSEKNNTIAKTEILIEESIENEEVPSDREHTETAEDGDENDEFISNDEDSVADDSDLSGDDILDEKDKSRSKYHYKCDICPQFFSYPHRLEAHQRRHKGLSGYPCTFENCSRGYNRLSDLRHHINTHNGIPNVYKCDIDNCSMLFSSYSMLNRHKRRVHKQGKELKTYTCEVCGKGLTSLRSLKGHLYIHCDKSQWPYACDEKDCKVRFRLLSQKKIHLKRHAGIKNFVCPHCGMRKTTSTELKIHINFHTFERKYPCRICSKVFKSVGTMGTHIRVVHEGKGKNAVSGSNSTIFQCSFCDRKLSSAQNKKYHEMTHTGEKKPYSCVDCGKTFIRPSLLKQHQIMHVKGEKPYVCTECGLRYKWPSHLKTHMKMHLEGVNPYPCEICGKRFKWPSNLKSHVLLHNEGSTPYTCEECGKGFRWPGSFYNHKKSHMKRNEILQKEIDQLEQQES